MVLLIGQVLLCGLLFGAAAYIACRDRPVGAAKKVFIFGDGERPFALSNVDPVRQDSKTARRFVHKRVLWMVGVWAVLCAPIVAYAGKWRLNWRIYVLTMQVCLLLGFSVALDAYERLAGEPRLLKHQRSALGKRNRATLRSVITHALVLMPLTALCIWLGRQSLVVFGGAAALLLGVSVWYYRFGIVQVDVQRMVQRLPTRRR